MVNYKNFTIYKPEFNASEEEETEYRPDILYARDETGRDWYDCQADFSDDTLKVMYDDKGVIVCISKDVTAIFPPGFSVAEVAIRETPPEACNDMTWAYQYGKIIKRVYSPDEKRKMIQGEKERRIAHVNQVTQTLNSKLLLGIATDEEKAKLRAWMDYVNEIEEISADADPEKTIWPTPLDAK
uniref:tail fiber assembly protein n=1 Tax=Serratia proteamaculans TaxID=28151 RepID=UPI001F4C4278|nr:tail fiber assembly protein [Serratia proteamaculans]ULG15966.1 tail assembly chaperone [Serratia proteamaculans]